MFFQENPHNGRVLDETFQTPIAIDLIAVGVGSLQGAMFAAGFKRIDLLGVAIIGIASGVGGGFLRDILLNVTPVVLTSNLYLITTTLAALLGMFLYRLFLRVDPLITLLDAVTIGLFGAIGTTKALALGLPVIPALFIGGVSAVGGGVLRDLMLNIPIALMHVGSLYAIASLVGSGVLLILLAFGVDILFAAIACVVVTTVLRLLAVRFGWSPPEQRALSRLRRRKEREAEATIEALQTQAISTIPPIAPITSEMPSAGPSPTPETS